MFVRVGGLPPSPYRALWRCQYTGLGRLISVYRIITLSPVTDGDPVRQAA
jgi:hypothetical protein